MATQKNVSEPCRQESNPRLWSQFTGNSPGGNETWSRRNLRILRKCYEVPENFWISKAVKPYFRHFEGHLNKKLLRETTVFSLSQYLVIPFIKKSSDLITVNTAYILENVCNRNKTTQTTTRKRILLPETLTWRKEAVGQNVWGGAKDPPPTKPLQCAVPVSAVE